MQEAPVVPPPATPFPYQPVPAPMPSAWDASASGWKLHDAVPASDAWSQDLDRLLQTGTTGDASVAGARPQDPCLPPPPTATTPLTSTTPTPPANNTKPPRLTKGVAGVEELPPRGKPKPSAWTSSASGWRLHDTVPASDAWSQDLDRLLQTSASTIMQVQQEINAIVHS
ncbi:hypothetical protein SDRG_00230 [Saprolegnia diclina VS20]|uniref:Uncharacterized protein n=1 Tax=Saprolegnia diclina (strain VS20) TaxID=1156394 RepID=T0SI56_SAPDV|nr:hypothetical protein SDRG_00230 [Saprolegnia diclina VS20]EQC42497.1 hypothetical protein SDRG_00230 [Saprolegnia diclina VS20]|eukprot:XP_008603920.1 hypothetical protein SDRG_00230 [Saprolegnia diclina VS20]